MDTHNTTESLPDEMESYLQGLTDEELERVESRAKRIRKGRRDSTYAEGYESSRWLMAYRTNCFRCSRCKPSKEARDRGEDVELERIHGPYWFLEGYTPSASYWKDGSGRKRPGRRHSKYIGRQLPADLAAEFDLAEGVKPEDTDYVD